MYNPGNYFFPSYGYMMPNNFMGPAMRMGGMGVASRSLGGIGAASRGLGLFSRLGNSMGFLKNINWVNLFSNTSRALGVVNQAIPIVKQAGPMFSNMRSMLKVASVFKDVTDGDVVKQKKDTRNSSNLNNTIEDKYIKNDKQLIAQDSYNYNYNDSNNIPNFFI